MKKLLLFMVIFLITILSVNAQTWTMTLSDVTLGGSSQEREENATVTLTVTNTGTGNLTDITLSSSAASAYNIGFSPANISSLLAGASTTVTVEGYVPDDKDAGSESIGTITATGTGNASQVTATSILSMNAENNLKIRDVEVTVNGDDTNLDDGDDVKVFPVSEVEMVIELKNTHSDLNIEDIEITVEGEDDLDDIDENDDISRIKDGKKDTVSFSFTIDEDAEDGTYDVTITIEGEDENGAIHGETWTVEFDLNEEGIIVTRAVMQPESLRCGDDSFDLELKLTNVGTRDEDDAAIEIVAESLDYEKRVSNMDIEEDDNIIRTYTIPVASDADVGTHLIEVRAFMDFDEQTHRKFLYFTVPSGCSVEEDVDDTQDDIVVNPPADVDDSTDTEDDLTFVDLGEGDTISKDSSLSVLQTTLLVLANILVLVVIAILVMKFIIKV